MTFYFLRTSSQFPKLLIFIFAALALSGCHPYQGFQFNQTERTYLVHIPKNLPADAPLMVVLHGYGNKAGFIKFYSRMNAVANQNGFGVVYPQGSKDKYGKTHWDADLSISQTDDVGFITSLASHLKQKHALDPRKLFVFGVSNGGFMAYKLAETVPEQVTAIGSVVGTMSGKTWRTRDSSAAPVPVIQFSGMMDHIVPMDGSMSKNNGWGGAPHIESIVSYWAHKNGATQTDTTLLRSTTTKISYLNQKNQRITEFYKIENMGHSFPRKRKHGLDTSQLIWDFFDQF